MKIEVSSVSFGLLCVSFANIYRFVCASFPFGFEYGMLDLVLLVPDPCLSIYSTSTVGPQMDGESLIHRGYLLF